MRTALRSTRLTAAILLAVFIVSTLLWGWWGLAATFAAMVLIMTVAPQDAWGSSQVVHGSFGGFYGGAETGGDAGMCGGGDMGSGC